MAKTCKIPKNAKNASKSSKFLGFAAWRKIMSTMVSERGLGQDTERVGLLPSFGSPGQPLLKNFHLRLANMHSCPIMVLHVSQQFFILVGLSQYPLQVSIELDKHRLLLSGQQIIESSSIKVAVTTNPPQLIKSLLILQPFVALLQI